MSEDNNVGRVSGGLAKRRFLEKARHTENFRQYDGEVWNSDDVQFLALSKKRTEWYDSFKRRHYYDQIRLSFFGYYYHHWTMQKENRLDRPAGTGHPLRPEEATALREFLVNKPADENLVLPAFRGDYHLAFKKRSFLGATELRWQFFHHKSEWEKARSLPFAERKRTLKKLKLEEERQKLWFAADQSDKLLAYMDAVLPYPFLP